MSANFVPISSSADLRAFIGHSLAGAAVLYIHDPSCGVSVRALREVARLEREVGIVDVARHHSLGQAIEQLTGIRHESPQVIVFRDGSASWAASHGRVTELSILRAAQ